MLVVWCWSATEGHDGACGWESWAAPKGKDGRIDYNRALMGDDLTELKSLGYARHFRLLKEVQIAFHMQTEQRAIVSKLDALASDPQRLAAVCERYLAASEVLKKSLFHRAFIGER